MFLWNMFTRKHKAVPRSNVEKKFLILEIPRIAEGFGFGARSNDYKIVRIYPCYRRGTKPQVKIYSLSTDSWRSLDCEIPTLSGSRPTVFLNGNLHWFASKSRYQWDEVGYQQIVSFDVTGEVFYKMALPEEISHVDSVDLVSLAVLNDLLAVLISCCAERSGCPEQHSVCSVWVMRDYEMPESWTKLYTFEASGLVTGFDDFTLNGELLMKIHGGKRVCRNLITGHEANLQSSMACDLVTVVESLVSV
ncbi:F-box protein At4g22390-like isoform X1 [Eucalyptus grandis]|uniref:F-box associated beta-propeller type 1 domain-containing protein n=1 Tax=Eucalyptus globulus TaxID=34317 RepID=A0ABD3J6P6_EUCGL|nr:F-box protein At4g22390-like isoform X1 [Eucalyptus grandis]